MSGERWDDSEAARMLAAGRTEYAADLYTSAADALPADLTISRELLGRLAAQQGAEAMFAAVISAIVQLEQAIRV